MAMSSGRGAGQAPVNAFAASNAHVNSALSAALQQLDHHIQEATQPTSNTASAHPPRHATAQVLPERAPEAERDAHGSFNLPASIDATGHAVVEDSVRPSQGADEEPEWRPMSRHYSAGGAGIPRRHMFGSTYSVDEPHTETVVCGFNLFDFGNQLPDVLEWLAPFVGDYKIEDMCSTRAGPGSRLDSGVEAPAAYDYSLGAAQRMNIGGQPRHIVGQEMQPHEHPSFGGQPIAQRGHPSVLEMPYTPSASSSDARVHDAAIVGEPNARHASDWQRADEQALRPGSPPLSGFSTMNAEPTAAMHVGLLGVPVPAKTRQGSLDAIRELPHHLNSATYDTMYEGLQSQLKESVEKAATKDDMPDPMTAGLQVYGDIVSSCWGLGRIASGHVGAAQPDGSTLSSFVTEILVPKALDTSQLKRLNASLRSAMPPAAHRDDLAKSYGAVPARLTHSNAGVWIAWSDPLGGSQVGTAVKPLREALMADPPRSSKWRLAVARQICAALAALHAVGKSHGCLGPRSILVSSAGDVCILESGLVDALLEVGVLREYDLLQYLGLEFARYLAPEGWQMPRQAGCAADMWALGLILVEVLCAAIPPNSECTHMQQLSAKMLPKRGHYNPLAGCRDDLLAALPAMGRQTIEACFSASAAARPDALRVLFSLSTVDEAKLSSQISSAIASQVELGEHGAPEVPASIGEAPAQPSRAPSITGSSGEAASEHFPARADSCQSGQGFAQLPPYRSESCPMAETPREKEDRAASLGVADGFVPAPRDRSWPTTQDAPARLASDSKSSNKRASRGAPPPPPPAPPPAFGPPTRPWSSSGGSHHESPEEQVVGATGSAPMHAGQGTNADHQAVPEKGADRGAADLQPSRDGNARGNHQGSNIFGSVRRSFGRLTG